MSRWAPCSCRSPRRVSWITLMLAGLLLLAVAGCRTPPTPTPTPTPTVTLGELAFVRHGDVWTAGPNGENPRPVTRDAGEAKGYGLLRWSPDGSRLAFVGYDAANDRAALYLAADGQLTILADDLAALTPPAWSPDGSRLAYVARLPAPPDQPQALRAIRVFDLATRQVQQVGTFPFTTGCVQTSPDPADALYWSQTGFGDNRPTFIWTALGAFLFHQNCDLTNIGLMPQEGGPVAPLDARWTSVALSPDGKAMVAVVAEPDGTRTLILADADGDNPRPLMTGDAPIAPVWSPEGRFVYYITRTPQRELVLDDQRAVEVLGGAPASFWTYRSEIRRVRVDGSVVETVLASDAHGIANLTFSRDGSRLLYALIEDSREFYQAIQSGAGEDVLEASRPEMRLESVSLVGEFTGFVLMEGAGEPALAGPYTVAMQPLPRPPTRPPATPTRPPAPETPTPLEPTPTQMPFPTPTPRRPATPTPTPRPFFPDWKGEYFANRDLSGQPALVRNDHELDFDWGGGAPGRGVPVDNFSARWTRKLSFPEGNYRFQARTDDGVRVFVDARPVIDEWREGAATYVGYRFLRAGPHDLRVEYYEGSGEAHISVWWELFESFAGWRGEYFDNPDLAGDPVLLRDDKKIDFNWEKGSPATGVPADNFSIRWGRRVNFEGGTYRFTVRVDDGVRLYVDGKLVIDEWHESRPTTYEALVTLDDSGHDLRLDYFERTVDALVSLSWERVMATPTPTVPSPTPTSPFPTSTPTPVPTPTLAPPTVTPEFHPLLAVDVSASPQFTIYGSDWPPGAHVELSLVPPAGQPYVLGIAMASNAGRFQAMFTWQEGMPSGPGTMVVAVVPGTDYRAEVPFLLLVE